MNKLSLDKLCELCNSQQVSLISILDVIKCVPIIPYIQDNNGDTPLHISIKGLQFSFALKLASNTNILDLRNNKEIRISILTFKYYYDFYLSQDDWRLEQRRLIIKEFVKKNFYNSSEIKQLIREGVI